MSVAAPPRPPVRPGTAERPWDGPPAPLARAADDAWPRTNRVLPWLIATFVVMVLCTPFDSTELRVALPVDAKLDRLMIVVMTVAWLGAMFAGGVTAPRWRRSPVNLAVVAFVAVAVLSLVVNMTALVQQDELSLGMRRFSILLSWAVFFFIVASTIRPREIPAFIKLVLIAACVTAAGVLVQHWFQRNLFFEWWTQIVPSGLFEVRPQPRSSSQFVADPVTGPMSHALALAAVMAMAMAYAIAGLITTRSSRSRLWYLLACALLLGAVFATGRKTGGFATIGMVLVLFAMRPRQMLRFLPLAVVIFGLTFAVRPGAVERQLQQLNPTQVATDASGRGRTEDYRAITPDVRERPLLGKGYGTYDPAKYRILDNEALVLVLEVGFIGLGGFYGILLMVGVVSQRPARSRHPALAMAGIAGAGAAGALGVSALLFDVLGFPAPEYVFFFAAGLCVVAAQASRRAEPEIADSDPLGRLAATLGGRPVPAGPSVPAGGRFRRPADVPAPRVPSGPVAERQAAREHEGARTRASAAMPSGQRFARAASPGFDANAAQDQTTEDQAVQDTPRRGAVPPGPGAGGQDGGRWTAGLSGQMARGRTPAVALVVLALVALLGRSADDPGELSTLGKARGGQSADPFAEVGREPSRKPRERADAGSPAPAVQPSAPRVPAASAPTRTPPVPAVAPEPGAQEKPATPKAPKPKPGKDRPGKDPQGQRPAAPAPSEGEEPAPAAPEDCLPGDVEAVLATAGIDACRFSTRDSGSPATWLADLAAEARLAYSEDRMSFGDFQTVQSELVRLGLPVL